MFNSTFKIIYLIQVVIITIVRSYYTLGTKKDSTKVVLKTKSDTIFLLFEALGMIIPLIYVFSSLLDFADYYIPSWIGWIGAILFGIAILLLWKSHKDLGKNWSVSFSIKNGQKVIKNGIYKHIRHPLYAAHFIWAIAQILMLNNWIAGYSFLIVFLPHYLYRVRIEEKMMIDEFGEEYISYMRTTGRLLPKF